MLKPSLVARAQQFSSRSHMIKALYSRLQPGPIRISTLPSKLASRKCTSLRVMASSSLTGRFCISIPLAKIWILSILYSFSSSFTSSVSCVVGQSATVNVPYWSSATAGTARGLDSCAWAKEAIKTRATNTTTYLKKTPVLISLCQLFHFTGKLTSISSNGQITTTK